jgi:hypothetical protein
MMDFCSEKELVAQTGHESADWPLVVLKELVDNALDACEESRVAPVVDVRVGDDGITVTDNGPGIPAATVAGVLDFAVRVSSREAYVAPDRGAQGNALKTLVAMPFALRGGGGDDAAGRVEIRARGLRHAIAMRVDAVRREPVVEHVASPDPAVRIGTSVAVGWPDSASSIRRACGTRFLQLAADYAFLNPHLTMRLDWFGTPIAVGGATDPAWAKWRPGDPTSAHWYGPAHLARLIAAYVGHDAAGGGGGRTVREFAGEFRGLSGTAMRSRWNPRRRAMIDPRRL